MDYSVGRKLARIGRRATGCSAPKPICNSPTSSIRTSVAPDDLKLSSRGTVDWFSTVRLRSGYAIDNIMIFGTGGIALAGADYKVHTVDDSTASINLSDSYTATGWTAGAGVEWGFSANSSAKIEYLYTDLGKKEIGSSLSDDSYFKAAPSFQSIRIGVDFRF